MRRLPHTMKISARGKQNTLRPIAGFLDRLNSVKPQKGYFTALCPAHDDQKPSLSVSEGDDGRVLLKCHAGCSTEDVVSSIQLRMSDLFEHHRNGGGGRGAILLPDNAATAQPCTLQEYAHAKRLRVEHLKKLRLSDVHYQGPSSGGKSYLVESVLRFVPESAYYALTAMSDRALAYSEEPLSHRFLVLYEAAGMGGDFATYLMRSLLSEGRLRYETVEKVGGELKPRLIEREGPTGLIVTTTAARLHPENETGMLGLSVTDTPEQTRHILAALARESGREELDLEEWHALQEWLESADHRVTIPFADVLAEKTSAVAVRLRRDLGALLCLIRAHTILHQATRERDPEGRIIATLDDYAVVRELVADLVAEGVEATVPKNVRETVEAVKRLHADASEPVTIAAVARELKLDKSAASRRVRVALDGGYLNNLEDRKGRPARLMPGDPLPDDVVVLPTPEEVLQTLQSCGVVRREKHPPRALEKDEEVRRTGITRGERQAFDLAHIGGRACECEQLGNVVYCDWCERPIEDARNGNVYWYHDRQETLYFNHKRYAWQHDYHLQARAGGSALLSEALDQFLVHLLGNTGVATDEDWRRLRRRLA
jgi:hypothetical protein